jgi:hypothetical protein
VRAPGRDVYQTPAAGQPRTLEENRANIYGAGWRKGRPVDEAKLMEKLRLIEALYAGAATDGERVAAERARERILERLSQWEKEAPAAEYKFTMADMWSRKVLLALLRRYDIRPYRYSGQRHTTVMARVSRRFVEETLWPEFEQLSETLRSYLSEVTDRVVAQVIHRDSSEAEVVDRQVQLPLPYRSSGVHGAPSAAAPREPGPIKPTSDPAPSSNADGSTDTAAADPGPVAGRPGQTRADRRLAERKRKKRNKNKRKRR